MFCSFLGKKNKIQTRYLSVPPFSRYHPDKNGDDLVAADMFKEVTFSYNILSDPDKRHQFDNSGFEVISYLSFKSEYNLYCLHEMLVLK